MVAAHRFAYEERNGPIPDGFHLHHACGERSCVNPDHLELLTASEHTKRHHPVKSHRLNRMPRTHCRRGHEMTPENTYAWEDRRTGRMQRQCVRCRELRYLSNYHGLPLPPFKDEFAHREVSYAE